MATRSSHNKNNSAIKRIMQEARELADDPSTDYSAAPLEDDIFEWHCTLRGPAGTEFEGGVYHFRILLPSEYPFRPPSVMMLTPNGRFELNTKICISFTSYHEELWQPAWGVRTAIIGLQGFFPLKGQAAAGLGAIEAPASERKRLAKLSREWICPECKITNLECLPDPQTAGTEADCSSLAHSTPGTVTPALTSATELSQEKPNTPSEPLSLPLPHSSTPEQTIDSSRSSVLDNKPATRSEEVPEHTKSSSMPRPELSVAGALVPPPTSRITTGPSPRPPIIFDAAICVLLIFVVALVCRKLC